MKFLRSANVEFVFFGGGGGGRGEGLEARYF